MISDKDLFLKSINSYFMKQGNPDIEIVKIKIIGSQSGMFMTEPVIKVEIKINDQSITHELKLNMQDFKIFMLEQLSKESLDFDILSRKKFKLIIIKYIRRNFFGLLQTKCSDSLSNKEIMINKYKEFIKAKSNIENYYKSNEPECDSEFDNHYKSYAERLNSYLNTNLHFKHFNLFFNFDINKDDQFNSYKIFIRNYKRI